MSSQTEQAASLLSGAAGPAPQVPPAGAPRGSRLLFIDNLRVLLICMVVVQHLAVTYGAAGSWYYHDPATNMLTAIILTTLTGSCIPCSNLPSRCSSRSHSASWSAASSARFH